MKMIVLHEAGAAAEVLEGLSFSPQTWLSYLESYKYSSPAPPSASASPAAVRKYGPGLPTRISNVFNKGWSRLVCADSLHKLVLVLLTLLVYSNSLDGDFVHDDVAAIVTNRDVTGPGGWAGLWTSDFWGLHIRDPRSHKSYRPLTVLTFRVTVWLVGLDSRVFHATNLLLHLAAVLLLHSTLAARLLLSPAAAAVAAALFAVHPVHAEAVTGLVGRADLLAAIFMLLAFRAGDREPGSLGVVTLYSVLALLSKETGVMVLPILAAWTWNPRRPAKQALPLLAKYALVSSVLVYLRLGLNGSSPIFSPQDNPASFHKSPLTRFLTYSYLWAFHLVSLLCPATLSYDWQLGSVPLVTAISDPRNLATAAAGLGAAALARTALASHSRPVLFSLLFTILPFVPASNLLQTVGFVAAERTLYVPSLGWCVAVALGLERLLTWARAASPATLAKSPAPLARCSAPLTRCTGPLAPLLRLGLLATLAFSSARLLGRNTVWQSRATLFRSGLASTPGNAKVWYNYANYLRDQELDKGGAARCYKEAVRLWPSYVIALNNLATVTDNMTDIETLLLKALHLDSGHATSLFNLGDLYRQQQLCHKSRLYFSLCLASPDCLPEASSLLHQCHDPPPAPHQPGRRGLSAQDLELVARARRGVGAGPGGGAGQYGGGVERCNANLSHCV